MVELLIQAGLWLILFLRRFVNCYLGSTWSNGVGVYFQLRHGVHVFLFKGL
jgi:hypothetical protein